MFWGLTIEPGKHYSQTVDQSFHVSMAALDTREKSGMTQLLVRHEKAEFLLCTLQYGDDIQFPCCQQALDLNLAEGSEISFYSEGKGTIHMTGFLVTDEPMMEEDPELVAEANCLLVGSEDEDDSDSDDDEEDDYEDEEDSDSDMESTSSQDVACNWQKLITEFDGDEDDEEEDWTPDSAKKGGKKKRKSQDDSMSDDLTLAAYKKKRKAAVEAENLSKMEIAADDGVDEEEEEEEEEDGDFIPNDDFEGEDDDSEDDEDDEEEEDEEEEEEEEEKPKPSPKKKAQTPKGKEVKAPTTSPQKASMKKEETASESQESTDSPLKKKKKKKQKEIQQGEESVKDGELPLKNLKTNNKENIEVQRKEKAAKKEQADKNKPKTLKKIKLPTGTTIEDLVVGEGKLARPGKKVFMFYRGVLANNQKEFDSKLSGKPFMFGLGKGEVIKGWDSGIVGMKVGGKRRLTVPPSQAYGSQRVGPIPANSTLVFDVELKHVK